MVGSTFATIAVPVCVSRKCLQVLPMKRVQNICVDIGEPSAKEIITFSCKEYSFVFFFSTHYYAVIAVVGVYAKTNFHVTPVQ